MTCDRDEFLCNATNDCIPMEWRCDGDADCDSVVINGVTMGEEDEQGCAEHVAALERESSRKRALSIREIPQWAECTAEIETATASLLKLHHVVNLLPLLSPEVT